MSLSTYVKPAPLDDGPVDMPDGDSDGQFACAACEKKFSTSDALWQHARTHEGVDDMHSATQRLHSLSSPKEGIQCPVCEQSMPSRAALTKHISTKHSNQSAFGCGHCGKQFICSDDFRAHMQSSSCLATGRPSSTSTQPSSANSISPPSRGGVNHRNEEMHWPERSLPLPDHTIPTTGGHSVDAIANSLHSALGSSLDPGSIGGTSNFYAPTVAPPKQSVLHKCPLCPKQFTKAFQLNFHVAKHQTVKQFPCRYCLRVFNDSSNRLKHEKICKSRGQGAQSVAPTITTTAPRHAQSVQPAFPTPNDMNYTSSVDQQAPAQPDQTSLLTDHSEGNKILGKRAFYCRKCNKVYGDSSNRLRHEKRCTAVAPPKTATGVRRPVSADGPVKRRAGGSLEMAVSVNNFKQCAQAAEPVKVFDDRGKAVSMYSCQICGKLLQVRHSLELHYMSHLGIKPHACSWCEKRFTDPSNWRKHCKTCPDKPDGAEEDNGPPTMVSMQYSAGNTSTSSGIDESMLTDRPSTIRQVKPEPIEIISDTSDVDQDDMITEQTPVQTTATDEQGGLADSLLVQYNQELGSQNMSPAKSTQPTRMEPADNAQEGPAAIVTGRHGDDSVVVVDSALSWFHDSDLTALSSQTEEVMSAGKESHVPVYLDGSDQRM